jgi:hypothetical protein
MPPWKNEVPEDNRIMFTKFWGESMSQEYYHYTSCYPSKNGNTGVLNYAKTQATDQSSYFLRMMKQL